MIDRAISRMAGMFGCDKVTALSEFTARRGRIALIVPAEDGSRIENMTEERPLPGNTGKQEHLVSGMTYMATSHMIALQLSGTSGIATIVVSGVTKTITFSDDLETTAAAFVTANAADYLAAGVILTSFGSILFFKSLEPGTDTVTGESFTSIPRDCVRITLTGTSGTATVAVGGVSATATFDTDPATTAAAYVTDNAATFLASDIILTSDGDDLVFESEVPGVNTVGTPSITNATGDLAGTVDDYQDQILLGVFSESTANKLAEVNKDDMIYPDFPLTKFTPGKGSFWVYYNYE